MMERERNANSWVVNLNSELEKFDVPKEVQQQKWKRPSIYKLPASCFISHQNNNNKNAVFLPQTVSFGPYHHEDEQLKKKMEYHKHRALCHFLRRSRKTLETLVDNIRHTKVKVDVEVVENDNPDAAAAAVPPPAPVPLVQHLMDCYDSLDEKWRKNEDEFLKLMIVDGCFMLEVLQWSDRAAATASCYAHNDPIFSHHGKLYFMSYMRRDMLMLENQLPMLLLKILHSVEIDKPEEIKIDPEAHLNNTILKFCTNIDTDSKKGKLAMGTCLHILDLYRKSLLIDTKNESVHRHSFSNFSVIKKLRGTSPDDAGPSGKDSKIPITYDYSTGGRKNDSSVISGTNEESIIRSVVNLHEAGIKFKLSESYSLNSITFQGEELRLPMVVIDDTKESTFLNLMAFERFHVGAGNDVTSYVCFMDNIIDSAEDVKILKSSGIVYNAVGSDKAVAKLFNEMTKDVTPDPRSRLEEEVERKLNDYCKNQWHEWRANLIHTYFRCPWAFLSLFAAVVLLTLTILQTFYTIYPYYHPRSST